jgi:hypothetical protein
MIKDKSLKKIFNEINDIMPRGGNKKTVNGDASEATACKKFDLLIIEIYEDIFRLSHRFMSGQIPVFMAIGRRLKINNGSKRSAI